MVSEQGEDYPEYERRPSSSFRRKLMIGACAILTVVAGDLIYQHVAAPPSVPRPTIEQTMNQEYPTHKNITATVFWVGEGSTADSGYIPNHSSAWVENWVDEYGGIDTPDPVKRCGYHPCAFTPKQNPFYFALPFSDYTKSGPKSPAQLAGIPWYDGKPLQPGQSTLKNRWVEAEYNGKKVYVQWEDVGPVEENDAVYVFGSAPPKEKRSGFDLSPAAATYLGLDGKGIVSWRFIDDHQVPDGPWKEVVTTTGPVF